MREIVSTIFDPNLWTSLTEHHSLQESDETPNGDPNPILTATLQPSDFSDKISYAFQLATAQGPMCHEPVQGIAVFLEEVTITPPAHTTDEDPSASSRDQLGRLTGEIIRAVRDSIHQGFMDWSPRLMLAMYSCEIQASSKPSPFPTLTLSNPLFSIRSRSPRPRL